MPFPIRFRPGAWVLAVLLTGFTLCWGSLAGLALPALAGAALGVAVGIISTCVFHELGHAFFAVRAGATVEYLEVRMSGAVCVVDWPEDLPVHLRLPTHLGGVAANLAGGAVFAASAAVAAWATASSWAAPSPVTAFFGALAVLWVGLGAVNLLPFPGFDGLKVVWALAARRFDPERSQTVAFASGWALLLAVAAALVACGQMAAAGVAFLAAGSSLWAHVHTARIVGRADCEPVPAETPN